MTEKTERQKMWDCFEAGRTRGILNRVIQEFVRHGRLEEGCPDGYVIEALRDLFVEKVRDAEELKLRRAWAKEWQKG